MEDGVVVVAIEAELDEIARLEWERREVFDSDTQPSVSRVKHAFVLPIKTKYVCPSSSHFVVSCGEGNPRQIRFSPSYLIKVHAKWHRGNLQSRFFHA